MPREQAGHPARWGSPSCPPLVSALLKVPGVPDVLQAPLSAILCVVSGAKPWGRIHATMVVTTERQLGGATGFPFVLWSSPSTTRSRNHFVLCHRHRFKNYSFMYVCMYVFGVVGS